MGLCIGLLDSGHEMEHLVAASKQSSNLYDIYLMLCTDLNSS